MRLISDGLGVVVVDNSLHGASSRVAAGLINPITGHRLNITDGFDTFSVFAKQEYGRLDAMLAPSRPLYRPLVQQRLIKNPGQADYLARRLLDPVYADFIEDSLAESSDQEIIDRGHGIINIEQSAVVDTNALLDAVTQYLSDRALLRREKFDYAQLTVDDNQLRYRDLSARKIIFCEGFQAIYNPWLASLPFKLAQGDVLSVTLNHASPTVAPPKSSAQHGAKPKLLNWGNWLLLGAHSPIAKLGSTYHWVDPLKQTGINGVNPSSQAATATKLLESARDNLRLSLTLVDHEVGIRPTTKYRIPFIGRLSNLHNAYCFNGFGSKGCLLIPYYANQLSGHLRHNQALDPRLSQWL